MEALVSVRVTREVPPVVTEVGEKLLLPIIPVVMVSAADTSPGIVPPLEEKSPGWMLLVKVPNASPVTRAVMEQVDSTLPLGRAATVPLVRIN